MVNSPHKIVLLLLIFPLSAFGQTVRQPHVEAELVAASAQINPGRTLLVGVRLRVEPRWHVYWRNPGDSGEQVRVQWRLPSGFQPGPLLWPQPKRIAVPPLVNFGYEGEVILLTEILAGSQAWTGPDADLAAEVSWLVCEEFCIPGKASLRLSLPWTNKKPVDSPWGATLNQIRNAVPTASPRWKSQALASADKLTFALFGPTANLMGAEYFPFSDTLIQNAAQQNVSISEGKVSIGIPRSTLGEPGQPKPSELAGVVVFNGGRAAAIEIQPTYENGWTRLMEALLLAFLGGVVLNLMPCVFPVLCLKVLSFAQMGSARRRHILQHSAAYAIGILVSFWALAGTLIALRAGGHALGWGYQLQSPVFLAALAFLLVGLSINLFGVFELGGSLMGVGQKWASQKGSAGAFFSGVLATVVATPCTAPFMGTAMGYALSQPAAVAMGVFSALGLGLASPYVLFSAFPRLTSRLPHPGAWMVTFKQLMAFPLLLTAWWLLSVLALQSNMEVAFQVLLSLIVFCLGLWIYGLAFRHGWLKNALALFFVLGSLAWSFAELKRAPGPGGNASASLRDGWRPFSESALQAARATGQPVLVDFTAAWCITCQVNERVALSVKQVQDKLAEKKVILFRADWTNQDEAIAKKLESFGRNGVPLYVLYPPGDKSEPRLLPQLLTPDIVLLALDAL